MPSINKSAYPLCLRSVETVVYLQNEAAIDCYHGSVIS